MPRTPAKITKAEIERVLKGAIAGGFVPGRLEVEDGKIVVYGVDARVNEDVSPLEKWRRDNGHG